MLDVVVPILMIIFIIAVVIVPAIIDDIWPDDNNSEGENQDESIYISKNERKNKWWNN